jgi:hypothetical protein
MSHEMTFEQCRDVLARVAAFHRHMRAEFERLEEKSARARTQLVLDYLQVQEQSLAKSLERFRSEAPRELLDTWFQYSPVDEVPEAFSDIALPADMDIADVVQVAARFNAWLVENYRQLAEESDIPELRQLFESLIAQQQEEQRRLAKNLNEFADV